MACIGTTNFTTTLPFTLDVTRLKVPANRLFLIVFKAQYIYVTVHA